MRTPVTKEPLLRNASLAHIAGLCRELRVSGDQIRTRLNSMTALNAGVLLQVGAHASGCNEFGLLLGARHHPKDLGATGNLLMAAPNARSMLEVLDRHRHLIQDQALNSVVESRSIEIYYTAPLSDSEQRRQDAEFSLAFIVRSLRCAVGSALSPVEISFEHDEPASAQPHRSMFGCPVRFNRPYNRIVWDASVGNRPLVSADPSLFEHLGVYVEHRFGAGLEAETLVRIVRGIIASLLPHGEPSLQAVGHYLDLSTRTLQRKLVQSDAHFGELIDVTRRQLAKHYVVETGLPIADVAPLLGYSESAAFIRSFRRWYSVPPNRMRLSTKR